MGTNCQINMDPKCQINLGANCQINMGPKCKINMSQKCKISMGPKCHINMYKCEKDILIWGRKVKSMWIKNAIL